MSKKKSIKFKNIRLYPSIQTVDVWIVNDIENLPYAFEKRYGANMEYYHNEINDIAQSSIAYVQNISGTKNSESNAMNIVAVFFDLKPEYIVHESIHIIAHASELVGIEFNNKTDEWLACLAEYLFIEISDIKTYIDYDYEKS